MNRFDPARRAALRAIAGVAAAPAAAWCAAAQTGAAAATALPGDSVYQLKAALVDQDGRALDWSAWRGTPVLASMFYSSCDMVCPLIFETLHATLKALPAKQREATRVLLVTVDPARDSVAVLKRTAELHRCDPRWSLARGDEDTVRQVAAVLGIQYRRLESGDYNHSSTVLLLDRDGRIAARSGQLGTVDAQLVKAVKQAHA